MSTLFPKRQRQCNDIASQLEQFKMIATNMAQMQNARSRHPFASCGIHQFLMHPIIHVYVCAQQCACVLCVYVHCAFIDQADRRCPFFADPRLSIECRRQLQSRRHKRSKSLL